jgi:hypothetical protein
MPVGEQAGLSREQPSEPPAVTLLGAQPLVFPSGPAPHVGVDAPQERIQRRPVKPAVVVDPPETMGFNHRPRSSSDRSVRRWIRILRISPPLAFSASELIAGVKPVKFRPWLRTPRARKVYPRKVNEVCSCCSRR